MKITIKPEKKEDSGKEIDFRKIEPGTVFEYNCGAVALKLLYNEAVLLNYLGDDTWLEIADGYKTASIKKILGRLDEIIVVEE